jgi:hypothetical protein
MKNKTNASDINMSILIVTFKERFEYVKDLINKIRLSTKEDIVLAVNGNNEELMDEDYRRNILDFCSKVDNCYPIICPEFKSLPKLWNTLVIFSRTEYNFIICDDVEFNNSNCINEIKNYINETKEEFFKINNEFSHFVVTKNKLNKLNYFDERLCAFGEEDGDIIHSFILDENRPMPNLSIQNIHNKALYHIKNKDIDVHIDNKPRFNREFFFIKYKEDENGIFGMNPTKISKAIEDQKQYPYEMFIKNNKHNIKKFTKINLNYE